jgi:hypothetical protein
MVASQQEDTVLIPTLERNQQGHHFDRVDASIDEVPHEEVVGIGELPTHLK